MVIRGITYNSVTEKYTATINDPHYDYPDDNLYVIMDNIYTMNRNHPLGGYIISAH